MIGKMDDRRKENRGAGRLGFAAVLVTLAFAMRALEQDDEPADEPDEVDDHDPFVSEEVEKFDSPDGKFGLLASPDVIEVMVADISRGDVVSERVFRLRGEDWIWPS